MTGLFVGDEPAGCVPISCSNISEVTHARNLFDIPCAVADEELEDLFVHDPVRAHLRPYRHPRPLEGDLNRRAHRSTRAGRLGVVARVLSSRSLTSGISSGTPNDLYTDDIRAEDRKAVVDETFDRRSDVPLLPQHLDPRTLSTGTGSTSPRLTCRPPPPTVSVWCRRRNRRSASRRRLAPPRPRCGRHVATFDEPPRGGVDDIATGEDGPLVSAVDFRSVTGHCETPLTALSYCNRNSRVSLQKHPNEEDAHATYASIAVAAGLTMADYQAVTEQLGAQPAKGLASEAAGWNQAGLHVITVWDSKAEHDQFVTKRPVSPSRPLPSTRGA